MKQFNKIVKNQPSALKKEKRGLKNVKKMKQQTDNAELAFKNSSIANMSVTRREQEERDLEESDPEDGMGMA